MENGGGELAGREIELDSGSKRGIKGAAAMAVE